MKNILLSVGLCLVLWSCATTSTNMSSSYTKPNSSNVSKSSIQKIVVYAMTADENNRATIEDAFVRELGNGAIASYKYLNQPIARINHTVAEEKMQKDGYQAAMIVKLINQQSSGGQGGAVSVDPGLYYGFGGNWSGGIGINISPGSVKRTSFSIQSSLYQMPSADLLWSGTAVAANPDDILSMATDVAATTISKMHSDGIGN